MANSLTTRTSDAAEAPTATQNSSAAAVTMRPLRSSPRATASRFGAPPSWASLIRAIRNTP